MRKLIVTLFALIGLSAAGLAFADATGLGISTSGSPHNFTDNQCIDPADGATKACSVISIVETDGSGGGWNVNEEICRTCHVPHDHNATTTSYWTLGLLWNRAASTESAWSPYDSDSMNATVGDPSGPSLLCLSCHDGTVSVDTFDAHAGGAIDIDTYDPAKQVPNTGTPGDLSGSHPISMAYDDDPLMNDPATTLVGSSGLYIDDVLDGLPGSGTVECSSCHDVHDQVAVLNTPLLRVRNDDPAAPSALCLTCHDK